MNILKLILDFFSPKPKFGLGSLESPPDVRNIALGSFQTPVSLPDEYETELPPVEDQGLKGKCVGSAIHKIAELYFTEKDANFKEWVNLSDDDLYEQCKLIDGIPEVDGTYPSVGAKVAVNSGIATVEAYNTGNAVLIYESRKKHRLQGYAFVPADFDAICQAIYQNGAIGASLALDTKWYKGIIMKVLKSIGRHYVVLKGFKMSSQKIKGQNSWGIEWIGYIAGKLTPGVKAGAFEFRWSDYAEDISDIIAFPFTIPLKVLDDAKSKEYRFTKTMRLGDKGFEVSKLQERLKKEGFVVYTVDGNFSKETRLVVMSYQKEKGLVVDGIVGPGTRAKLNEKASNSIPAWARAIQNHEGYLTPVQYPPNGSRSYRNHSPANFKIPTSVLTAYMKKLGANGVDAQNFVTFPNYQTGFDALCTFLIDACNDKLSSYQSSMTLLQFFEKYAPSSDNNDPLRYARTVADAVGATVNTKISELL